MTDVKFTPGYGAGAEDLSRGYTQVEDAWAPEQDLANYKQWYTRDSEYELGFPSGLGGRVTVPSKREQAWDFQDKNRVSKGFLTRDPTERY